MYNSLNISRQADPGLECFLPKDISKIEQGDDMYFTDKNSL